MYKRDEKEDVDWSNSFIFRLLSNSDNQDELQTNIIDEKSILLDLSSLSDLIEDNLDNDDDQGKIHHSDSLYLLRKKVHNEDNNTSDDESQLSSTIESPPPQQIIDGV
jgi:hypothetical protein